MTFIDLFAGIGGFRRGMELAGHRCVGFCEYDKFAVASYMSMHLLTNTEREEISEIPRKRRVGILNDEIRIRKKEWYARDIRKVRADDIPKCDCWCFGFPCQDISIAGNRLGFVGRRSSLFFAVTGLIRDLEEKDRPSYLLIENVKNLFSVNGGFDFARLLIELDEIGYDAEWSLLNSADVVPQNRERVYIVGHLRGRRTRKVFSISGTDENFDGVNRKGQVIQVGNIMPTDTRDNPNQGRVYDPNGISPCLNKMDGGGRQPMIIQRPRGYNKGGLHEIAPTLSSSRYEQNNMVVQPVLAPDRMNKRQNGRRIKGPGEPMFTLTSKDRQGILMTQKRITKKVDMANTLMGQNMSRTRGNNTPITGILEASGIYTNSSLEFQRPPLPGVSQCLKADKHDAGVVMRNTESVRISRLTPRECFRLQGWDNPYFDRAELVNSDSQLYKQAGNGVTVTVVERIAREMEINPRENEW